MRTTLEVKVLLLIKFLLYNSYTMQYNTDDDTNLIGNEKQKLRIPYFRSMKLS